jgi:predicted dehydrogenase
MQRVAIFGSGFGLYGYMPAVLKSGAEQVLLPERYRTTFASRRELAPFAGNILWCGDEAAALDGADSAVIALKPNLQVQWVRECIRRKHITQLLLEKPLAESPVASMALFDELIQSGKRFRIGYMFGFTAWGEAVDAVLKNSLPGTLQISWKFLAHHFRHNLPNWKRSHAQGGGAIRFYGIHLIALLSACGYDTVLSSIASGGEAARWQAKLAGQGLPECNITLDCHAETAQFLVTAGKTLGNLADPLDGDAPVQGMLDKRVPLLARLCESLREDAPEVYIRYADSLRLWAEVERCTQWEGM